MNDFEVEEYPGEAYDEKELARQLRAIDQRHGRTTAQPPEAYAAVFNTSLKALFKGRVLNIGDPLLKIEADLPNVIALDYFYGTDVRPFIAELEEKQKTDGLTKEEQKELTLYQSWYRITSERLKKGAKAVKGTFPLLPFADNTFDRVVSLNSISMKNNTWEVYYARHLGKFKKLQKKSTKNSFNSIFYTPVSGS